MSSRLMRRKSILHSSLRYRDRNSLRKSSSNRVKISIISYNSKFNSYLQLVQMKRQRENC
jgi:predicted glycosyltransferase